jgi:hypothetical protein
VQCGAAPRIAECCRPRANQTFWSRMVAEAESRPCTAAWPRAQSTSTVEQFRQRQYFGHLHPHLGGACRGGLDQPHPGAFAGRGDSGVARRCRATSTGPSSPRGVMTTCSSPPRPWTRTHTVAPSSVCGTEYWPDSNAPIGVFDGTVRVVSTVGTGEADDDVSGRSHDHQCTILMAATGQLRGRLRAVSRGRRQSSSHKP